MSIPRYSINPLWLGIPLKDDSNGKLCEYRDYAKLEAENAQLKDEVMQLRHKVNYWKVEAECDHGRWLRCLEDLEHLRRLK
jgi:hypothetical protein